MIDSTKIPQHDSLLYKLNSWFVNNVNFCHGWRYDEYDPMGNPVVKPDNKVYNFFYKYWLWPFVQTDCVCCNSVRGLIYGLIIGYTLGKCL